MIYLLDTNALSDLMREQPNIIARVAALARGDGLVTCVAAAGELRYGVDRMPPGRRRALFRSKAENVLSIVAVQPVPANADSLYSSLKSACARAGRAIGENDLWIAVVAVALRATLVTRDGDFACVPGLAIEDWTR